MVHISEAATVTAAERVKAAFDEHMKTTPLLLDQGGFVEEYKAALQEIPEEQQKWAIKFIRKKMSSFGNGQERVGFRNWIEEHGLNNTFFVNESTQQQRYQVISKGLRRAQEHHNHRENEFMQLATYFRERHGIDFAGKFFNQNTNEIRHIFETEKQITKKRAKNKFNEMARRKREIDSHPDVDRLAEKPILEINIGTDENPTWLSVLIGLFGTSYYCGRPGGTYLFRFERPSWKRESELLNGNAPFGTAFNGCLGVFDEPLAELDSYSRELEKSRDKELENFTYCGYVPRPISEHMCRLRRIQSRVIHVVAATLTYCNWLSVEEEPEMVGPLRDRVNKISAAELQVIVDCWEIRFGSEFDVPEEIRAVFRESPVITEFVFLTTLVNLRQMPGLSAMVTMLEQATNWNSGKMAKVEDEGQGKIALKLLLGQHQIDSCLVFREEAIPNIHHHFGTDFYTLDPNHPNLQYPTTADSAKDFEKEHEFIHKLEEKWKYFFRAARQAGNRNRAQGSLTAGKSLPGTNGAELKRAAPIDESPAPTNTAESTNASQSTQTSTEPPVKRKRGRPKGSKNKPKNK
ncbi:hypothetical protein PWT90_03921 [Aphanocladium album]|nr:hypothetical protein PWT90_03921 [Aphanocladium album]